MHEKTHTRSIATAILTPLAALFLAASLFASCSSPSSGSDDPVVETPVVETPVTETPVTETPVTETPVKSSVCTLSALTVSAGTLVPAFDPAVTEYAVDVESSVKSITVSGTAADAKATVSESGAAARTLAIGETAIVLTVTAEDGSAKAYTVTAFRKPVVYVAGAVYDADETNRVACYWKGTTKIDLPVPAGATNPYATGIALEGGSVYVSGYYNNGSIYIACYWKDGIRTDLSSDGYSAVPDAITVVNSTVYAAGYYIGTAGYLPCYWTGGAMVALGLSGDTTGEAVSIAVSGGDVYTSGVTVNGTTRIPCYWKGTEKTALVNSSASYTNGKAEDIAIIDGKVNIAAWYSYDGTNTTGTMWTNGVKTDYAVSGANHTFLNAMSVDNGNTSYAGEYSNSEGNEIPFILNGSVRTDLPVDGSGCDVSALATLDGHSYVAGRTSTADDSVYPACYWDGTTRVDLSSVKSVAKGIALGE